MGNVRSYPEISRDLGGKFTKANVFFPRSTGGVKIN